MSFLCSDDLCLIPFVLTFGSFKFLWFRTFLMIVNFLKYKISSLSQNASGCGWRHILIYIITIDGSSTFEYQSMSRGYHGLWYYNTHSHSVDPSTRTNRAMLPSPRYNVHVMHWLCTRINSQVCYFLLEKDSSPNKNLKRNLHLYKPHKLRHVQ